VVKPGKTGPEWGELWVAGAEQPFQGATRRGGGPPRLGAPQPFEDRATGFRGWSVEIPGRRPVVTPCVGGGRIFLGGGFGSHEFYALDAATGLGVWARRTRDDGPTAAVVSDGFVVFNTESCTLCVMNADTGELVWERWLGDPLLAQPAVAEGRVFMAHPVHRRGTHGFMARPGLKQPHHVLAALALADGRPLWQAELEADVITAPVVAEGGVHVTTWDGAVSRFGAASGELDWRRELRATSAPWVWNGDVYVSRREDGDRGPQERTDRWRPRRRARSTRTWAEGEEELKEFQPAMDSAWLDSRRGTPWHTLHHAADAKVGFGTPPAAAFLHHAEALVGETTVSGAWRYQGSRPCVRDGCLYGVAGDVLTATRLDTELELWRWTGQTGAGGERALTPPAVVNGRVYAAGWDGHVRCWDAQKKGELRWSVALGAPALWQPVVSSGRVSVGLEDGRLVSFATGDPRDDGWPMWGGGPGHNG
jgi:Ca-activated chloride channel family protein